MNPTLNSALNRVVAEYEAACRKHGSMKGCHEGYAVILEELDELWALVKSDAGVKEKREEAAHVAAMAIRFMTDVG